jgi:signal transduction histidine kinase
MIPGRQPRFTEPFDIETLLEIRQRTLIMLGLINIVILCVSGTLGYALAGITLKPIEEMLKKQKRFVSDAAHEIKTPLTAIKTDLEVTLRDKNLSLDDSKKAITGTIEEVDKLHKLTNLLLKQSKYENGVVIERNESIDLKMLLERITKKLENTAKLRDIDIKTDLADIKMIGNFSELEELFTNLIENAVKYNKNGEQVVVSLYSENNQIVIKVEDHEIGIADQDLKNIFEPFYRSDKSRAKQDHDGYGLGLTISKEIVDRYKGKIEVKSEINNGSVFTVRFSQ